MKNRTASSFQKYHAIASEYGGDYLYRGVSKKEYELIPSAGRLQESDPEEFSFRERNLLRLFKLHSRSELRDLPENQTDWLVLAQHHGLPTRLLDWSRNPLVALFFAVEKDLDSDGAVYCFDFDAIKAHDHADDPLEIKELRVILPAHVSRRITAQAGMFSVHPKPQSVLTSKNLVKIIIPKNAKIPIQLALNQYGINRASLFPDIDGLSAWLKWLNGYDKP